MGFLAMLLLLYVPQNTDFSAEGLKALEANKYEEAAQLLSKAVEADPKDYSAQFNLALAYSFLGKDSEAIPIYKKVLELKPGLYEAELNLGMLLVRQKEAKEAISYLQAATDEKSNEFRPVFYLAEALLAAGDFQRAKELIMQGKKAAQSAIPEIKRKLNIT